MHKHEALVVVPESVLGDSADAEERAVQAAARVSQLQDETALLSSQLKTARELFAAQIAKKDADCLDKICESTKKFEEKLHAAEVAQQTAERAADQAEARLLENAEQLEKAEDAGVRVQVAAAAAMEAERRCAELEERLVVAEERKVFFEQSLFVSEKELAERGCVITQIEAGREKERLEKEDLVQKLSCSNKLAQERASAAEAGERKARAEIAERERMAQAEMADARMSEVHAEAKAVAAAARASSAEEARERAEAALKAVQEQANGVAVLGEGNKAEGGEDEGPAGVREEEVEGGEVEEEDPVSVMEASSPEVDNRADFASPPKEMSVAEEEAARASPAIGGSFLPDEEDHSGREEDAKEENQLKSLAATADEAPPLCEDEIDKKAFPPAVEIAAAHQPVLSSSHCAPWSPQQESSPAEETTAHSERTIVPADVQQLFLLPAERLFCLSRPRKEEEPRLLLPPRILVDSLLWRLPPGRYDPLRRAKTTRQSPDSPLPPLPPRPTSP